MLQRIKQHQSWIKHPQNPRLKLRRRSKMHKQHLCLRLRKCPNSLVEQKKERMISSNNHLNTLPKSGSPMSNQMKKGLMKLFSKFKNKSSHWLVLLAVWRSLKLKVYWLVRLKRQIYRIWKTLTNIKLWYLMSSHKLKVS